MTQHLILTKFCTLAGVLAISAGLAGAASVTSTTTADNLYTLWIDGSEVVSTTFSVGGWKTSETNITELEPGTHIIGVRAENHVPWSGTNPAGFLGEFTFAGQTVDTGSDWLVLGGPQGLQLQQNWNQPGFVPVGWAAATSYGANGVAPWNTIGGISDQAEWIWTEDNTEATGDVVAYFLTTIDVPAGPPEASAVPEPITMISLLGAVGATGSYLRRRSRG